MCDGLLVVSSFFPWRGRLGRCPPTSTQRAVHARRRGREEKETRTHGAPHAHSAHHPERDEDHTTA